MKPRKEITVTNVLGTIGVGYGLFLGITKNKSLGITALYVLGFGIAGFFIGNKISNNTKTQR